MGRDSAMFVMFLCNRVRLLACLCGFPSAYAFAMLRYVEIGDGAAALLRVAHPWPRRVEPRLSGARLLRVFHPSEGLITCQWEFRASLPAAILSESRGPDPWRAASARCAFLVGSNNRNSRNLD